MCVLSAGTQQKTKFYKKEKKTKKQPTLATALNQSNIHHIPFYPQARNRFFNLKKTYTRQQKMITWPKQ